MRAPERRASLSAMATACFRFRTFEPEDERRVPCSYSRITVPIFPRPVLLWRRFRGLAITGLLPDRQPGTRSSARRLPNMSWARRTTTSPPMSPATFLSTIAFASRGAWSKLRTLDCQERASRTIQVWPVLTSDSTMLSARLRKNRRGKTFDSRDPQSPRPRRAGSENRVVGGGIRLARRMNCAARARWRIRMRPSDRRKNMIDGIALDEQPPWEFGQTMGHGSRRPAIGPAGLGQGFRSAGLRGGTRARRGSSPEKGAEEISRDGCRR
jgi:hypothetical protein